MKHLKLIFTLSIFFFALTMIWDCASIKPPPGGPVDETPPGIVEITPPSGTVKLTTNSIQIAFSEYMDEKSFQNNISIFPQLKTKPEIKFYGDEIELILPDSLDAKITYVITLNRNIKDEHNVALAEAIQLAYSTGEAISNGKISGKVYGTEKASLHLWKVDEKTATDSLFATQPDYVNDAGDDGNFSFGYLSSGKYQILAIDKSGASSPLDTKHSAYGLSWHNNLALAIDSTLSNINMRLWKEPETLKLVRGEWSAFDYGRLYFNIDLPDTFSANINLQYHSGEPPQYYSDPLDKKVLVIHAVDSLLQKSLQVKIESIRANDDKILDSAQVEIKISEEADTTFLTIKQPQKGYQIIPKLGTEPQLDIVFSHPFILSDSTELQPQLFMDDSVQVEIKIEQKNPMKLVLDVAEPWQPNKKYKLKIPQSGIISANGRALRDSVTLINFGTKQRLGYGNVSGSITDKNNQNIVTELFSVKNPSESYTAVVNSKSEFELKTIPEGNYSLFIFKDSNKNMKFDFGTAFPIASSEWFYFLPDTFEVRTNWDTELAPIDLPETR